MAEHSATQLTGNESTACRLRLPLRLVTQDKSSLKQTIQTHCCVDLIISTSQKLLPKQALDYSVLA